MGNISKSPLCQVIHISLAIAVNYMNNYNKDTLQYQIKDDRFGEI